MPRRTYRPAATPTDLRGYATSWLACLVALLLMLAQAPLALGATPLPRPDLDLWDAGEVYDIAADGSGGFYIGGAFSHVAGQPRANLARILADGSLDPDFSPAVNSSVFTLDRLADGAIVIGGPFTQVDGLSRIGVARIDSDGNVDVGWNPGNNGQVERVLFDGAGSVYLGGTFTEMGGLARSRLARVDAVTGAVDAGWAPNANGAVLALRLTSDGKLWVGGNFTGMNSAVANRAVRLSATGSNDLILNVNGTVYQIQVDDQDRAYLCGIFNTVDGATRFQVARIASTGTNEVWGPSVNNLPVFDCELDSGALYLAGAFTQLGASERRGIARLLDTGALDPDFAPATRGLWVGYPTSESYNWAVRRVSPGRVAIGGNLRYVDEQPRAGLALLDRDDANLLPPIDAERAATLSGAVVRYDDGWLVGGQFRRAGEHLRENLLRLHADGELDTAWELPVNGQLRTAIATADGAAYLGGFFSRVGDLSRSMLFKLDDASQPVVSTVWTPSANGAVTVLYEDRFAVGERVYAGGVFTTVNATTRNRMARLSLTGSGAPDGYHPNLNGQVNAIAQPFVSFDIHVGGSFTQAQGATRNGFAAFDTGPTATLTGIDPSFDNTVWALATNPGVPESMYVAGDFTQVGTTPRARLARIDSGELSPTWNPGANNRVNALAPDGQGSVFASGFFTTLGGQPSGSIGKLSVGSGSVDPTYQPDTDTSPRRAPVALWVDEDGLRAAGNFTRIAGQTRRGLALLSLEGSTPVDDRIFADGFETASPARPLSPAPVLLDGSCQPRPGGEQENDGRMLAASMPCSGLQ